MTNRLPPVRETGRIIRDLVNVQTAESASEAAGYLASAKRRLDQLVTESAVEVERESRQRFAERGRCVMCQADTPNLLACDACVVKRAGL